MEDGVVQPPRQAVYILHPFGHKRLALGLGLTVTNPFTLCPRIVHQQMLTPK